MLGEKSIEYFMTQKYVKIQISLSLNKTMIICLYCLVAAIYLSVAVFALQGQSWVCTTLKA